MGLTTVTWECLKCNQDIDPKDIFKHLREVHGFIGEVLVGEELLCSARSKGYFMQQWQYNIEGVKLLYKIEVEE